MQFLYLLNKKNSKGFTLIELLIVIAIIGLLASVIIPNLLKAKEKANLSKNQQFAKSVDNIVAFTTESVPLDLRTQLVSGVNDGSSALSFSIPPNNTTIYGGSPNVVWSNDTPFNTGYSLLSSNANLFSANMSNVDINTDGISFGVWIKPTDSNSSFTWSIYNNATSRPIIRWVYDNNGLSVMYNFTGCFPPTPGCPGANQEYPSSPTSAAAPQFLIPFLSRLNINEWNYLLFSIKDGAIEVWGNGGKKIIFTSADSGNPISIIPSGTTSIIPVFKVETTNTKIYNPILWQDYFNPGNPGQLN